MMEEEIRVDLGDGSRSENSALTRGPVTLRNQLSVRNVINERERWVSSFDSCPSIPLLHTPHI